MAPCLMALLLVDDLRGHITALHCGLDTCQVYLDLYTLGLTPLRCTTTQAAVAIQVITGTHVECYDLPKVGVMP
jgi:hypothetical protein